jgi:hypothetical protein
VKSLAKAWQTCIAITLIGMLGACANDPVKEQAAGAKPINYGCSGTSMNDCMTFHSPTSPAVKR